MDSSKHTNKIQIKKYSELGDTWSIRPTKQGIIDGTQIDTEMSAKIFAILDEYGLSIEINISDKNNSLERIASLFGSENNLIEYRAEIVQKMDYDDFEYDYLIDHDFDTKDEMSADDIEKMMEEYENLPYDSIDGNLSYSFFVGKNIRKEQLKSAAAYYGYLYMRMLHDMDSNIVTRGNIMEDMLRSDPDQFKEYLKIQGITITNKNVERVNDVNYRIYKDTKFFSEAESELKDYKKIISQILEL